jgi:hypothetical protein
MREEILVNYLTDFPDLFRMSYAHFSIVDIDSKNGCPMQALAGAASG